VVLRHEQGMHLRPAQLLARLALQFDSMICLEHQGQRADAKSIWHMLALGAGPESELVFEARGADAEAALDALIRLVESDFASDNDTTVSQDGSG